MGDCAVIFYRIIQISIYTQKQLYFYSCKLSSSDITIAVDDEMKLRRCDDAIVEHVTQSTLSSMEVMVNIRYHIQCFAVIITFGGMKSFCYTKKDIRLKITFYMTSAIGPQHGC